MLPAQGYFLNVTAIKTTHQPTHEECVLDCIDIHSCVSINAVQQINNTYQCQLLSGDKHRNSTQYGAMTGSIHYYMPVRWFVLVSSWHCYLVEVHDYLTLAMKLFSCKTLKYKIRLQLMDECMYVYTINFDWNPEPN